MNVCSCCNGCGWENPADAIELCYACDGSGMVATVIYEKANEMHIMLDLETWGRTPGSDIRSIGAVVFDPVAGTIVGFDVSAPVGYRVTSLDGKFYVACDNPWMGGNVGYPCDASKHKYPLTRDAETVQWWNDQTPKAQSAFANPTDLKEACNRFAMWLEDVLYSDALTQSHEDTSLRLWCNGPHFDEAILAAVYRAINLPVPWHYRAPRDFRTITEAAGMTSADYINHGTAHNALDDAIAQAMTVCEAYKRLGLQGGEA